MMARAARCPEVDPVRGMDVWHERLGGMTYAWSVECPLNDHCLVRPLVHVIPGATKRAVTGTARS